MIVIHSSVVWVYYKGVQFDVQKMVTLIQNFMSVVIALCSVLNKLTLLTYQYETKQEEG